MIHFGEKMSKIVDVINFKNKLIPFLSELSIFKGFSLESLFEITKRYEFQIIEFESDEKIYSPNDFSEKVGFVFSGECLVEKRRHDGNSVQLNLLKKGDSFGILAVFSNSERFPTFIRAKKRSVIVFLDKASLLSLIKAHSEVAISVIEFMCSRIEFLNEKVATFSADSVEEKLACHILQESKITDGENIVLNLSKTANILNAGRASIYRALTALEEAELIKFENKKIYIIDREGLERITQ